MTCNACGKEIDKNAKFCPYCGEKVEVIEIEPVEENEPSRGPWNSFAKLGFTLGLIAFITSFVLVGIELATPAIVFSALGMKSKDKDHKDDAKRGLKFAIASIIVTIVIITVLAALGTAFIILNWDDIVSAIQEQVSRAIA